MLKSGWAPNIAAEGVAPPTGFQPKPQNAELLVLVPSAAALMRRDCCKKNSHGKMTGGTLWSWRWHLIIWARQQLSDMSLSSLCSHTEWSEVPSESERNYDAKDYLKMCKIHRECLPIRGRAHIT